MERLMWTAIFAITLAEWCRGVSARALQAIGDQCYSPTDEDPKGAARAYAQRVKQPAIIESPGVWEPRSGPPKEDTTEWRPDPGAEFQHR
jgi:hypothetical protein